MKEKPRDEEPAFDEASVPPRDDVHVVGSALRCPFCHEGVALDAAREWVACARCLARHHAACWEEAGRCGACRHERSLADRPAAGAQNLLSPGAAVPRALVLLLGSLALIGALLYLLLLPASAPSRVLEEPRPEADLEPVAAPARTARRLEGPGAVVVDDGQGRWVAVFSHDVPGEPTGLAFGFGAMVTHLSQEGGGLLYQALDDGRERALATGMTGVTIERHGTPSETRYLLQSAVPLRDVLREVRETPPEGLDIEALLARVEGVPVRALVTPVDAFPGARRLERVGVVAVDDGAGRWVAVFFERGAATGLHFGVGSRVEASDAGLEFLLPDGAIAGSIPGSQGGVSVERTSGGARQGSWTPESRLPLDEVLRLVRATPPERLDIGALLERCVGPE